MKRKGLVRLVVIVLALMLPLSAMAQGAALDMLAQASTDGKEIVTTLTFEPGTMLAAEQAVSDLSTALAIRVSKLKGGVGSFAVSLSNVDVVNAQMRVQEDGLYLQSETLGQQPLYFSWADIQQGITEAMRSSGSDDATISQFSQGFMNGFQQGFAASIAGMEEGMDPAALMTEEQIKKRLTEAMDGDDSFVKWMEAIEAKKVVTAGEFSVDGSDVADTKTEIIVTTEDMAALYDVPYIQKQIATQLKAKDATLTDAQVEEQVAAMVGDIKAEIEKSGATAPMTFYTQGEDELVAAEVKFTGTFTPGYMETSTATTDTVALEGDTSAEVAPVKQPDPVKVDVDFLMTRKTLEESTTHRFTMHALQDDVKKSTITGSMTKTDTSIFGTFAATDDQEQPVMTADLISDFADEKNTSAELAVTVYEGGTANAVVFGFEQSIGDAAIDTALRISYGESVEAIKADAANALMGTIKVNTLIQADSGQFAALLEATPDSAVQPMKMSQTDLESFMITLQSNAMQTLYKIIGNLPPSVSALLGGAQ